MDALGMNAPCGSRTPPVIVPVVCAIRICDAAETVIKRIGSCSRIRDRFMRFSCNVAAMPSTLEFTTSTTSAQVKKLCRSLPAYADGQLDYTWSDCIGRDLAKHGAGRGSIRSAELSSVPGIEEFDV